MKGKVYLGFDVETTGQYLGRNAMVALGMKLLDDEMNELDHCSVCLKEDGREREQRCMDEFWANHEARFKEICEKAVDPQIAMGIVVDWLVDVEKKYDGQLVLVTDNPGFDVAWINYYLSMYTKRPTLYYGLSKKTNGDAFVYEYEYRRIWDTDSVFHGALIARKGEVIEWGLEKELNVQNAKWSNTHNPEEDAANIAANYVLFIKNNCEPIIHYFKKAKCNSSEESNDE